jgi:ribosomal-protein-alanine N-acetyltransferase
MTAVLRPAEARDEGEASVLLALALGASGHTPRAVFRDAIAQDDLLVVAAADGGLVAVGVGRVAADELEIHTVAVAPHCRRQGLARRVVATLESEATAAGATRALLEVRASNHAAIALYRACGYVETGQRLGYYRDGEDARTMHHALVPPSC